MAFTLIGLFIVGALPFALAAGCALMGLMGTPPALEVGPDRKVEASYQPMAILTARSAPVDQHLVVA